MRLNEVNKVLEPPGSLSIDFTLEKNIHMISWDRKR